MQSRWGAAGGHFILAAGSQPSSFSPGRTIILTEAKPGQARVRSAGQSRHRSQPCVGTAQQPVRRIDDGRGTPPEAGSAPSRVRQMPRPLRPAVPANPVHLCSSACRIWARGARQRPGPEIIRGSELSGGPRQSSLPVATSRRGSRVVPATPPTGPAGPSRRRRSRGRAVVPSLSQSATRATSAASAPSCRRRASSPSVSNCLACHRDTFGGARRRPQRLQDQQESSLLPCIPGHHRGCRSCSR